MDWLVTTGKANQLAIAGRTATGTLALDVRPGEPDDVLARVENEEPEPTVADLTSRQLLAEAMAALLPRSTAFPWSTDGVEPYGDEADEVDLPVVLDPACGDAALLMAVANRFGDHVKLVGQARRESVAATAALNLRGDAHGVAYEIHVGDSLMDNRLGAYLGGAAAVVCELPADSALWPAQQLASDRRWTFGVPETRDGELAWVQHCYAHLRPQGVAVVAVSSRACVQPSGQRIRAELVRSGVLRDVIALPKGMGSEPGTDIVLWVLQRPHGAFARVVRMADLRGLDTAVDVPRVYGAWYELLDGADPAIVRAVPRQELLDSAADLLPSRYVASRGEVSADDLARVIHRLRSLYTRVGAGFLRFEAPASPVSLDSVTLGELERGGALTIRSRDTTPRKGDLLLRTLGRPPMVATGTAADDTGVAQVVELDPERLDADFVATFLRADAAALPVANTLGALSRDDLRRCRIPRMPLAEQRRYGDTFRRLHELDEVLSALAKVSANVIAQAVHGLTTGSLAPNTTSTNDTAMIESETSQP